jgi:hypothetical protein
MGSIIFWVAMIIVHAVNARVWKDKPTNFWYKLSWFFIGWSVLGTIYAISEYVSH